MSKAIKQKSLDAKQANRLAMELQIIKIKCAETALKYTFNGKSFLWGSEINNGVLERLKIELVELDRKQQILDSDKYNNLQYLPSNSSIVNKIKDHFADDERYAFTEVREGTTGKLIATHIHSKSFITNKIKQQKMATVKKAAKKAAPKKAAKKSAPVKTAKKAAPKKDTKVAGDSIRSFVDNCVKNKMDNAAILAALDKAGYAYSINSVRWYASKARGAK